MPEEFVRKEEILFDLVFARLPSAAVKSRQIVPIPKHKKEKIDYERG